MRTLPYGDARCTNDECVDRFNCSRFTDKPTGVPLHVSKFPTPETSGECPDFILNTPKDK